MTYSKSEHVADYLEIYSKLKIKWHTILSYMQKVNPTNSSLIYTFLPIGLPYKKNEITNLIILIYV
jgi:hypothetical protein